VRRALRRPHACSATVAPAEPAAWQRSEPRGAPRTKAGRVGGAWETRRPPATPTQQLSDRAARASDAACGGCDAQHMGQPRRSRGALRRCSDVRPATTARERVANAGQRIYLPRAVGRVRLVEAAQQRQRDLVLVVAGSGVSGLGATGAGRIVAWRRVLDRASVNALAVGRRVRHFLVGSRGLGGEAGERAFATRCEAPHGRAAGRFARRRRPEKR